MSADGNTHESGAGAGRAGRGVAAGVRSGAEKETEIEAVSKTETETGAEAEVRVEAGAVAEGGAGAVSGAEVSGGAADEGELSGDGEEVTVRDAISAPDAQGEPRRTTRRFPLFTRDTARPEGGGRAAPGDAPAPARQWPILTVLSAVALGLLLTALDVFRVGTILIGAALLAGAVMRWMLPSVGMLAVRSRFTDMVTYSVLGVAIVVLALMAQPHPVLEIPFLDDTLHFTVR